jgi:diphosphomevalonate decarboxylase
MTALKASARARSNIALVKYWGKRDAALNLPATGSISITLDTLWSETHVEFDAALERDAFTLDGEERDEQRSRVSACLDLLRARAGVETAARVESRNNFPTAAGLASSASGFAALVVAADRALGLGLAPRELSILARRGSGSAARSLFGGFVEMHLGQRADGADCFAEPLAPARSWPLEVVVAVTARARKDIGSGSGMTRSAATSPYYGAWVETHPADLDIARTAIRDRDFAALAEVSERSCLKMHAAALAAAPPLLYWSPATLACMTTVVDLRRAGVPVFFTIDAGPQVKAVCAPGEAAAVGSALAATPGVVEVLHTGLGPGPESW